MLLTVSKRLEFSASRRLFVPDWSDQENLMAFGPETGARYGTGRNYVAYFVFTGPVNPTTGMLINISKIKDRAGDVVAKKFDHKFLNEQNPAFRTAGPPTPENIARQLYLDVAPLFSDVDANLCGCHLTELPGRSATFYAGGACDANYGFGFSAARRTRSPHLSDEENRQTFGDAISPHGHYYRARVTFRSEKFSGGSPLVRHHEIESTLHSLPSELDHRFLNEIPDLKDRPITTESLAAYLFDRINANVPSLHRIRLHERNDFFAEFWKDKSVFLGMEMPFSAAHRLHASGLSQTENIQLYGKCNNPLGHGHSYATETTIGGEYDSRSGTLFDFLKLRSAIEASLEPWQDRHLDLETEDFRESPSTGENIVRALWPKIDNRVGQRLVRLRLWETPNNRFTLRRT